MGPQSGPQLFLTSSPVSGFVRTRLTLWTKRGKKLLKQILFWRAITHFNDGDPVPQYFTVFDQCLAECTSQAASLLHCCQLPQTMRDFKS